MATAESMGLAIATEVTTAENALSGSETNEQIRLAMAVAVSRGILPNLSSTQGTVTGTNAGAGTGGQWARIGYAELVAAGQAAGAYLTVTTAPDTAPVAWVKFQVDQLGALGTPPTVSVGVAGTIAFDVANFKAVTVTNDAAATVVELYAQSLAANQQIFASGANAFASGVGAIMNFTGSEFAALPAGTQTEAVWLSFNNLVTFSDARGKEEIRGVDRYEAERFIQALNPVEYQYRDTWKVNRLPGFLAQEVLRAASGDEQRNIVANWELYDEADSQSPTLGLTETRMLPYLVATVQRLLDRVWLLERQLAARGEP